MNIRHSEQNLPEEVVPGIFRFREQGGLKGNMPSVNIYAIPGEEGILFDAGYGTGRALDEFMNQYRQLENLYKQQGKSFSIKWIIPSHCHTDHFSGLKKIRQKTGAGICLTKTMAGIIRSGRDYSRVFRESSTRFSKEMKGVHVVLLKRLAFFLMLSLFRLLLGTRFVSDPDRIIEEEGDLVVNGEIWRIISTPGHSFDHISLYHPGHGILLGGDNVLMGVTPWLGPPWSHLKDYLRSLELMLELPNLSVILPAHGSIVHEPRKRIELLIHWRRKRLQDLFDIVVRSGVEGLSAGEALESLYGPMNAYRRFMARGWIVLSLSCLEKEDKVYSMGRGRQVRYYVK